MGRDGPRWVEMIRVACRPFSVPGLSHVRLSRPEDSWGGFGVGVWRRGSLENSIVLFGAVCCGLVGQRDKIGRKEL